MLLEHSKVLDIVFLGDVIEKSILCMQICKMLYEENIGSYKTYVIDDYGQLSSSEEHLIINTESILTYVVSRCLSLNLPTGKLTNQGNDLLFSLALRQLLDASMVDWYEDVFSWNNLQSMHNSCRIRIPSLESTIPIQSDDIEFLSQVQKVSLEREIQTYSSDNDNLNVVALVATKRKRTLELEDANFVRFIIDSGCSTHLTNADLKYIYDRESLDTIINTASGVPLHSSLKGSIGPLTNVLHAESAPYSLLSVSNICDQNIAVIFTKEEVFFTDSKEFNDLRRHLTVRERGQRDKNLYVMDVNVSNRSNLIGHVEHHSLVANAEATNRYTLWHQRLNHCSHEQMRLIRDSKKLPDMIWDDNEYIAHRSQICHGCATGKMVASPTRKVSRELLKENHPSNRAGGLILIDVFFSNITSYTLCELGLILVDAYSKCIWVKFGRSKDEVTGLFEEWLLQMKGLKFDIRSVAVVRSDNGGEFISQSFVAQLNSNSITPERAPPYAHVNRAERAIRHVKETARAYINTNRVNLSRLAAWRTRGRTSNPYIFWTDAMTHASAVFNAMPEKKFLVRGVTRYERFFDRTPDYTRLKVFGCTAYVHISSELRKSFDQTSFQGVYLGFNQHSPQTWRVMNAQSGRIIESRTVVFNENVDIQNIPVYVRGGDGSELQSDESYQYWQDSSEYDEASWKIPSDWRLSESVSESYVADLYEHSTSNDRRPNFSMDQVVSNVMESIANAVPVPNNVYEAKKTPEWSQAYDKEIQSFIENDILEFVHREPNMKVLGWRWVFRVKENTVTGSLTYKARGTLRGDRQVEGIDYDETFAPVARLKSLRMLMSIACHKDLEMENMDVNTAFLYGEKQAEEPEVYVLIPAGYPIPGHVSRSKTEYVGKLKRHVYGLKQAPRTWFRTLSEHLIQIGFKSCLHDPCLFVRRSTDRLAYIFVYVDDLIIATDSVEEMQRVKSELTSKWSMKDMGALESILGIRVLRNRQDKTITLNQEKYIDNLLLKFKLGDVRAASTPLAPGCALSKAMSPQTEKERTLARMQPYRELVGSLMYLMVCTRPDIAFAISQLSRYTSNHGSGHWSALMHVIRYVKGSRSLGITYRADTQMYPRLYSDASYASDIDSSKSVSAYVSYVGGGPISWKSKLQSTTALSTCESEYIALCAAAQEAVHLKQLFHELMSDVRDMPVVIYEDNRSTIDISKNTSLHEKQKHVKVKYHYVRECVLENRIQVQYLSTRLMVADILTKPVQIRTWEELISPLMGPVDINEHVSQDSTVKGINRKVGAGSKDKE